MLHTARDTDWASGGLALASTRDGTGSGIEPHSPRMLHTARDADLASGGLALAGPALRSCASHAWLSGLAGEAPAADWARFSRDEGEPHAGARAQSAAPRARPSHGPASFSPDRRRDRRSRAGSAVRRRQC